MVGGCTNGVETGCCADDDETGGCTDDDETGELTECVVDEMFVDAAVTLVGSDVDVDGTDGVVARVVVNTGLLGSTMTSVLRTLLRGR